MSEHRPGPWHVSVRGSVRDSDEWLIAEIAGKHYGNAHLIAAAPEMYEVLVSLVREVHPDAIPESLVKQAREAIAKARGES